MKKPIKALFISNWKHLDYNDYFPSGSMNYDGVEFVTEASDDIDVVVICNYPTEKLELSVAPNNIFHVHQEPGDKLYHGFMFNNVVGKKCSHLLDADIPTHPCLNWLVNKTYDELSNQDTSLTTVTNDKQKLFSGVISGHNALPGHYFRLQLLEKIKENSQIDLFGKRHNFIPDKWDALYPYQYSLAMENSHQSDYWTEKIMDCYLACTMPVYYGCSNIDKYFPKQSYISLDANNLDYSITEVKEKMASNYFAENYQYILEARELCLMRYSTAPGLSNLINTNYQNGPKKHTLIPAFKRSVFTDIKRKLLRNRTAHRITGPS